MKIKPTDILNFIASNLGFTPSGGVSSTNVQDALEELDSEKVTGPASATDNAIVRFDGTSGKLIKNSSLTISDSGVLTSSGSFVFSGSFNAPAGTGVRFDFGTTVVPDSGGTTDYRTMAFTSITSGANNLSQLAGGIFDVRHNGSGTCSTLTGLSSGVRNTGGGTSASATGVSSVVIATAGTITQGRGLWIRTPTVSGTGSIATNKGILIDSQKPAGVTTSYAIDQVGTADINRFAGLFYITNLPNFADDTAAAAGGVAINQLYRNGSQVMIRVT